MTTLLYLAVRFYTVWTHSSHLAFANIEYLGVSADDPSETFSSISLAWTEGILELNTWLKALY